MNQILLLLSCFVAVAGDMLFVWWAKKDTHPTLAMVLALILCNIAALIWSYTMRKGIESATAITFYALFTVAGCSFLGFVIFKEPLSVINSIGLALGIVALILISIK
jgi:multidrug transporter EmrE-like cation transporter